MVNSLVDQPALNDVTELDNKRDVLGLLALALLILIVFTPDQAQSAAYLIFSDR